MLLTILICTGQSPKKDFLGPGVKSSTLASKFPFLQVLMQTELCTSRRGAEIVPWLPAGQRAVGGAAPTPHSLLCPGLNQCFSGEQVLFIPCVQGKYF